MPVEMMVMIGYLFWLYWWQHIYANVFDGNHANDSGNGDHDDYADDKWKCQIRWKVVDSEGEERFEVGEVVTVR